MEPIKEYRFSFCCKCANRKTKPTERFKGEELIGCKKLTKKQWDKGLNKEGFFNQKNCPVVNELKTIIKQGECYGRRS